VTKDFGKVTRKAGVDDGMRFHDLRHTHASLLLGEGVHLKVVSERLGHSGIAITADLYSHVLPGLQKEAVMQLDKRIESLNGGRFTNDLQNSLANSENLSI
jgi:integrase